MKWNQKAFTISVLLLIIFSMSLSGCFEEEQKEGYPSVTREEKLPDDITKLTPDTDQHPPILHSDEYEDPVPLSNTINTRGAEDSPFILPDGETLYFFFTPDVRIPAEEQVTDDVSGVWVSQKNGDSWSEPERVWLQKPGKLALDGAVCVQDDEMWFASVREGYSGPNMFTAEKVDGQWKNWEYAGDRLMDEIQIGEVHIHGDDLYFHSDRSGGHGSYDIWMTARDGDSWSDPVNIEAVNTETMDGFPFITSDGKEMWFTRTHNGTPGIFRSVKVDGNWSKPELIVSQFAGEPTLDDDGNLYFVHHYYEDGEMIEADIYVSYRR
ncbi:MAG: hypothetical protein R6U61_03750 [Thermoplasmata archaeon]